MPLKAFSTIEEYRAANAYRENTPARYTPTLEEIEEAKKEIQATWDDEEREKRAGIHAPPPVEVTRCKTSYRPPTKIKHGD